MTEYDFNLQNLPTPAPERSSRMPLAITMMVFGLTLMGSVTAWQLTQPNSRQAVASVAAPETVLAKVADANNSVAAPATTTASELGSPTDTSVAGLSTTQDQVDSSGFAPVTGACRDESLFQIGSIETDPAAHPVDELNWAGATDVLPESDQPFIVGQSTDQRFAWRLSPEPPAQQSIVFEVSPDQVGSASLVLSWSAGYSFSQAITAQLDNLAPQTTATVEGSRVAAGWQQLAFTQQQLPIELTAGQHTLTLTAANPAGEAIVWDGLQLSLRRCP